MKITLNGQVQEFTAEISIEDILFHHKINPATVIIELNELLIKSSNWNNTFLKENDVVEIITFMGGGQWKAI